MPWHLARSLEKLRTQTNELSPNRSRISDGTIGDRAHSSRSSHHNPDASGAVRALDITHDPAHGIVGQELADALLASRDERIDYIIANGKIVSGATGTKPWTWRSYSGKNPHDKHIHISVVGGTLAEDERPWTIDLSIPSNDASKLPSAPPLPALAPGSKGTDVAYLQKLLGITVDHDFGPKTKATVIAFQKERKLVADGRVGPYTWAALQLKGI